jgi:hypothetical protein
MARQNCLWFVRTAPPPPRKVWVDAAMCTCSYRSVHQHILCTQHTTVRSCYRNIDLPCPSHPVCAFAGRVADAESLNVVSLSFNNQPSTNQRHYDDKIKNISPLSILFILYILSSYSVSARYALQLFLEIRIFNVNKVGSSSFVLMDLLKEIKKLPSAIAQQLSTSELIRKKRGEGLKQGSHSLSLSLQSDDRILAIGKLI